MPKFTRKRAGGFKRGGFKKGFKRGGFATVGYVNKVMNKSLELKYKDTTLGHTLDNGAFLYTLNSLSQGTTGSTRVGQKILMRTLQMSARVVNTAAADQTVRVAIVLDRQNNGAAPTGATLYSQIYAAATDQALRNIGNMSRFKVLYDMKMNVRSVNDDSNMRLLRFYKKLYIPATYNTGNAGDSTDIQTNAVYIVLYGTEAAATAAGMVGYCRLSYTDA